MILKQNNFYVVQLFEQPFCFAVDDNPSRFWTRQKETTATTRIEPQPFGMCSAITRYTTVASPSQQSQALVLWQSCLKTVWKLPDTHALNWKYKMQLPAFYMCPIKFRSVFDVLVSIREIVSLFVCFGKKSLLCSSHFLCLPSRTTATTLQLYEWDSLRPPDMEFLSKQSVLNTGKCCFSWNIHKKWPEMSQISDSKWEWQQKYVGNTIIQRDFLYWNCNHDWTGFLLLEWKRSTQLSIFLSQTQRTPQITLWSNNDAWYFALVFF